MINSSNSNSSMSLQTGPNQHSSVGLFDRLSIRKCIKIFDMKNLTSKPEKYGQTFKKIRSGLIVNLAKQTTEFWARRRI